MNPLAPNTVLPSDQLREPVPNHGRHATIFRVVTAVAKFFRSIGLCPVQAGSWFRNRVFDLLPEQIRLRLNPRRVFLSAIEREVAIPSEQREAVMTYARPLIKDDTNRSSIKLIIEAIAAISPEQRQAVITHAHPLIRDHMGGLSINKIIEAIAAIPPEQREAVITYAHQLIRDDMNGSSIGQIIETLAKIPPEQREAVIAYAHPLIRDHMNGFPTTDIIDVIEVIAAIPPQQREAVMTYAHQLIRDHMNLSIYAIIQTIAAIPPEQREAVITYAHRLIRDHMNGFSIAWIIHDIVAIRPEQREEVVRNAQFLITPQMSIDETSRVIQTLANIPHNERDFIINLALQAITENMRGEARLTIIRAVTNVPTLERANVMEHALELINAHMNPLNYHARAMIIRNVANRPQDQRADYIQQQRQQLQAHAVRNFQAVYQQGIYVHAGDRDHRVRRAIELLRLHQGEIDEAIINQAVEGFTQYLDNREMDPEHKRLARRALLEPKVEGEHFGPLISDLSFTILGLEISGRELIGRFWIFASQLTEPEQGNAKHSMILALKDSYSAGDNRVCNQGKTQRLIVGVLQGRLQGVDIELIGQMQVTTQQAAEMFFATQAHRDIQELQPLLDAANRFCALNPNVNREHFIRFLTEDYARVQEMIQ